MTTPTRPIRERLYQFDTNLRDEAQPHASWSEP